MTAGRGLVHSELPEQEEGLMEGFQLWLNLPAKDKMREPWYRDIQSEEIPEFTTPAGVHVRVIAGESHGVAGAMQREHTEPLYLDITLPPGAEFAQPLPDEAQRAALCVPRIDLHRKQRGPDKAHGDPRERRRAATASRCARRRPITARLACC